ncbi:N(2)-fixation sustaining protein CowN [Telmatospirillum sp. J64-1]|uniref:N(2)-fixation sustaining protein CowN n=1 Tax=Telmatospirillum sp. J64-1 TaxID=2502183 RepID=UPI00115EF741|nr:N(2)-fixation sustaining protein CowN [Telmatospirillum sp. J64-1]
MDVPATTDRYKTFQGIDCEGNSRQVIERVLMHINDPAKTNAFWERFKLRLAEAEKLHARRADELCLACSHTYYIEELFEEYEDAVGLELLRKLEEECC